MNKNIGLILILVGLAVVIAALVDFFEMSAGVNLSVGDAVQLSEWPMERIALLAVGVACLGIGAYTIHGSRSK